MSDQNSESKTLLDQLFWGTTATSTPTCELPNDEAAPSETNASLPHASSPALDRIDGSNIPTQPTETTTQETAPADSRAGPERHHPENEARQSEPAEELPSVRRPAVQPIATEVTDAALAEASFNCKRGEITELMDTLRGALDKIEHHGSRVHAIVQAMLLHARAGSVEHQYSG
jgi:hypothetical protein